MCRVARQPPAACPPRLAVEGAPRHLRHEAARPDVLQLERQLCPVVGPELGEAEAAVAERAAADRVAVLHLQHEHVAHVLDVEPEHLIPLGRERAPDHPRLALRLSASGLDVRVALAGEVRRDQVVRADQPHDEDARVHLLRCPARAPPAGRRRRQQLAIAFGGEGAALVLGAHKDVLRGHVGLRARLALRRRRVRLQRRIDGAVARGKKALALLVAPPVHLEGERRREVDAEGAVAAAALIADQHRVGLPHHRSPCGRLGRPAVCAHLIPRYGVRRCAKLPSLRREVRGTVTVRRRHQLRKLLQLIVRHRQRRLVRRSRRSRRGGQQLGGKRAVVGERRLGRARARRALLAFLGGRVARVPLAPHGVPPGRARPARGKRAVAASRLQISDGGASAARRLVDATHSGWGGSFEFTSRRSSST
mmetsp:Transcript_23701/g.77152  ORF Transcript_23701/g.77152 Transcript_23701/m.77152 type:complete len:422 (+) Transcript_23701:197-1462(+)